MLAPNQWIRKIGLVVGRVPKANGLGAFAPINAFAPVDLSSARIKFTVSQIDAETPNNAEIRVYNLAPDTVAQIQQNANVVYLQAGYATGAFGNIFTGQIKQFRRGKEDAVTTYLDILAGDGDRIYNWGQTALSLPAGSTYQQQIEAVAAQQGVPLSVHADAKKSFGGTIVRGKVQYAMTRDIVRDLSTRANCSWSFQNGVMRVVPFNAVDPTAPIVLSAQTGVVGIPEQTDEGIKVRCLLNPLLQVYGSAKIDNSLINQTQFGNTGSAKSGQNAFAGVPFNQRVGQVNLANVNENKGIYKIFCVEHEGDMRGGPWYSTVTLLSLDPVLHTVVPSPA